MSLIAWCIIGLVAGVGASRLFNGSVLIYVRNILLGMVGATVGGTLFHTLLSVDVTIMHVGSMVTAALGAVLLLGGIHFVRRGADASRPA